MTRKNYSIDEVLTILTRKKNVRIQGFEINISSADILGNKSLGKIDFLLNKGYSLTGISEYKKRNNLIISEKDQKSIVTQKSNTPIHNGKQELELVYGCIPSFYNLGKIDRLVFKHTEAEKKQLKLLKSK